MTKNFTRISSRKVYSSSDRSFPKVLWAVVAFGVMLMLGVPSNQLLAQQTYSFTTGGATGQYGPTQTQINNAYQNTPLSGKVNVVNGIQYWVVPQTGLYNIESYGAQGYGPYGGRGAKMSGEFLLTAGDTLKILVGQKGAPPVGSGTNQYGGGGGTFLTYTNNSPILIAGGGGGSWATSYTSTTDASTSTSGNTAANGPTNGSGGSNGSGGAEAGIAGGGGGLTGNGGGNPHGGLAFINGGIGGRAATNGGEGGFGGGGGANSWDNRRGGGGGGYSGGGGAGSTTTGLPEGGGGGSYNSGNNQDNLAGVNTGDGSLLITVLSSGAPNDAGVISIDSPNVYCAGTHNVVATIQNFGTNILDSARLYWSVNGTFQDSVKYTGPLDTVGGSGSATAMVTLGSYTFTSSAYNIKVWVALPNGVADTVNMNDTAQSTKQANLPPPTGITASTVNATNATIKWTGGSASNSWLYTVVTSGSPISGTGTASTVDTAYLSSLSPTTTYDFYVREVCPTGDTSTWAGPFTFRTPCAVILSGTYTINPSQPVSSSNFVSISDAVDALIECGISSSVTFNIAPGTYVGQIEFSPVPGASSGNTITFDGYSSDSVTLRYSATTQATMATVLLDGADWIRIKNMRIEANGSTYGVGVHFANSASNNILNNTVIAVSAGSANSYLNPIVGSGTKGAVGTGDAGDSNLISNNILRGGYRGIYYYGPASNNNNVGNKFINNDITDFYYYGMMIYYQSYLEAYDNKVYPGTAPGYYACYFYYCHNFIIERNEFIGANYNYLYYANYSTPYNSAFASSFSNNIVIGGSSYGLYFYYGNHLKFQHNTIRTPGGTYGVYGYNYPGTDIDLRNNIFSNGNGGVAYYFYNANLKEMDYNIFDGTINVGGTVYSSLAAFQAAYPGYNQNSSDVLPDFVNLGNNNLRLDPTVQSMRGASLGYTSDVDGDARCIFAPSVGADESDYPEPLPVANFGAPDSIYVNSPYTFNNAANAGDAKAHAWYLNGIYQTSALHFRYVPSATGTDTIKLVTQSCGGIDSITKMVIVEIPPRKPEAAFIADKNVVDVFEEVKLSELSEFGPVSWEWQVSPPTYSTQFGPLPTYSFMNGTSEFSQNPIVVFDDPGTYTIMLIATNSQGSDTAIRSRYIVVKASANMCIFPFETSVPSGILYDEGGPTGNYSSGRNGLNICYYLIDPCASTVTLDINEFDLSTGDYLRVYDGEDKTGTPLWDAAAYPNGMNGGITNASVVTSLTAQSGKMYIEFESDNSTTTVGAGFAAEWSSTPGNFAAPVADFLLPDTLCVGIPANFENISTGVAARYSWDADGDGIIDGNNENLTYTFAFTGNYDVTLIGENCGGTDSITKSVTVIAPSHAPNSSFTADIRRPNIGEFVNFFDATTYCVDYWRWEITPSDYTFVGGTNVNSQNPQVVFNQPGYYDVKLVTGNSSGLDSVTMQQYIYAIQFCTPAIVNLNTDLGISRFVLGDIDNSSSIGDAGYTDYTAALSTELEKGASYVVTLERNTANNPMNRKVWIDYNQDGDFDDAGELVASQSSSFSLSWTDTFTIPASAVNGATRLRVGTSFGSLSNDPCGPNSYGEYEDYRVILRPDVSAPEIAILGSDTVTIEQCRSYTDAGATAMDNVDGNLTSQIMVSGLPVDSCTIGMHSVTYTVTDAQGNIGMAVRIVNVIADTTNPVITLIGNNPDTSRVHTSWTEPGYSATDNVGGNLTSSVIVSGNVDTAMVGTYTITYSVEDAEGNRTVVTRTVVVADDIAPVVTLTGSDTMYVEVGDPFTDPGATVTDDYDANPVLTVTGTVDVNTVGTYILTYCSQDQSGNTTCIDRVVIVQDTEAPVVTLIGANPFIVDVYSNVNVPGVNVNDNYYSNFTITTSGTWDGTADSLGDFTIVYTVTDGSGNVTTVTRTVRVVDRVAPSISLNGQTMIYLERWENWTDPGVTVNDNYDNSPTVHDTGNYTGTLLEGFYYITYWATDQSGNKSREVTRYIVVTESTTGLDDDHKVLVNIYPNPNRGQFVVELETPKTESVRIAVTDMMGREIKTIHSGNTNGGKFEVDLPQAKQGVYFIKVTSGEETFVKKFMISR